MIEPNRMRALILSSLMIAGCGDSGGDGDDAAETVATTETTASTGETGDTVGTSETTADTGETTVGTGETTAGTGETTDTGGEPECTDAGQCMVVNNCCECSGAPLGQEPPCDILECLLPSCEAMLGSVTPAPACRLGQCTLAPLSCDPSEVLCDIPEPPACDSGLVRAVVDGCYGPCVPPTLCQRLPFECDDETCGPGWFCMNSQSGATSLCAPLPNGCGDTPTCGCVGALFGEICNGGCSEAGAGLLCEDGG